MSTAQRIGLAIGALVIWLLALCFALSETPAQDYDVGFRPPTAAPGGVSEVTYVGSAQAQTTATSISVALPSCVSDCLAVATMSGTLTSKNFTTNDADTWTTWHQTTSNFNHHTYYRVLDGTEGGTVGFKYTDDTEDTFNLIVSVFSGVETVYPIESVKGFTNQLNATVSITPTADTTSKNVMLYSTTQVASTAATLSSAPTGYTQAALNDGVQPMGAAYYKLQATPGSAGTPQWVIGSSSRQKATLLGIRPTSATATVAGPLPVGSGGGTNVDNAGGADWSNPGNIVGTSNNTRATLTVSGTTATDYLRAANFGFSIPGGATPVGIVVIPERSRSSGGTTGEIIDNVVSLVNGSGAIVGDNKAKTSLLWPSSSGVFPIGEDDITYGDVDDDWGASLTAADINDADFGVVIAVQGQASGADRVAQVDRVQIIVYYE